MFELGGNHDSVMALYDEALGEARAFGDAEGVRHVLRVMAHRCDAIGRDQDAARHTAEADKIEQVIGKPISAKHVFNQVDGGRTAQPILEKLAAPRGSKTGSLPWCRWEQSIADVTLSVPLPADVRKAALSIAFSKQRVRISLTGGVVIADCVLCAPIKPDECSWTLSDGTACIMLEKVERKVNIEPQLRKERKAALFREDLEKQRLAARREKFCHYEPGGLTPPPDSLGYIGEADRFVTDIAGVMKEEREAEVAKREGMYHNRRMQRAESEDQRWSGIEQRHTIEQARLEEMRENYSYARSNKTSMPYNPINLRYDDGADGDRLAYSDQSMQYRGQLRADFIQRRNASTPYNPITNEEIRRVIVPARPQPPP